MQSVFQNGYGIGSHRVAAITLGHGTPTSMWGGLFTVAAGGQTAIHHHWQEHPIVVSLPDEYWSGGQANGNNWQDEKKLNMSHGWTQMDADNCFLSICVRPCSSVANLFFSTGRA
jgi:hypothetical protein